MHYCAQVLCSLSLPNFFKELFVIISTSSLQSIPGMCSSLAFHFSFCVAKWSHFSVLVLFCFCSAWHYRPFFPAWSASLFCHLGPYPPLVFLLPSFLTFLLLSLLRSFFWSTFAGYSLLNQSMWMECFWKSFSTHSLSMSPPDHWWSVWSMCLILKFDLSSELHINYPPAILTLPDVQEISETLH